MAIADLIRCCSGDVDKVSTVHPDTEKVRERTYPARVFWNRLVCFKVLVSLDSPIERFNMDIDNVLIGGGERREEAEELGDLAAQVVERR